MARAREPRPPAGELAGLRREAQLKGVQHAVESRKRGAAIKQAIREDRISDLKLVRGEYPSLEPHIEKWPVERLLRACFDIGPVRTHNIIRVARVKPSDKVGELTWERRALLARLIIESRS